jgi:hypothetical protein
MDIFALMTFVLVLSAWFILNRWVLPWFGVPTCMCGSCSVEQSSNEHQLPKSQGESSDFSIPKSGHSPVKSDVSE